MVLATPNGAKPHIDEASASAQHFEGNEGAFRRAEEFYLSHPSMNPARTLRSVIAEGLENYATIFVPGGQGPVVDLMQDPEVGEILRYFHTHKKPTAMLCHGPIASVENDILHAEMCFHVVDALQIAGGEVITTAVDFEPHVVEDRELITGQNPRSDHLISKKLIEALERAAVLA